MSAIILPKIPVYITVHLGAPTDANAPNIQETFIDYIKNVASCENIPTWPENALKANILAQISFALNRIYLNWYSSRGYNFDITNDTEFDQEYCYQRNVFENISQIVDEIFDQYLGHKNYVEPYFAEYCNGITRVCPGMSQWGTVDLADQGFSLQEILNYYYGDNIYIVENAPLESVMDSYSETILKQGMKCNNVCIMQHNLNEISKNYSTIPKIISVDGIFGYETEKAVKAFQKTFDLPESGKIDKKTWYKIIYIYNNIQKLSMLIAKGLCYYDSKYVYPAKLEYGAWGADITAFQYYLNIIGYFNQNIPLHEIDGYFGYKTLQALKAFQNYYGLTDDGVIKSEDWRAILGLMKGLLVFCK